MLIGGVPGAARADVEAALVLPGVVADRRAARATARDLLPQVDHRRVQRGAR